MEFVICLSFYTLSFLFLNLNNKERKLKAHGKTHSRYSCENCDTTFVNEENGIYLEINGVKHLGYLSMKNYDITGLNKFPRFHTVECITIKQFKENGSFDKK